MRNKFGDFRSFFLFILLMKKFVSFSMTFIISSLLKGSNISAVSDCFEMEKDYRIMANKINSTTKFFPSIIYASIHIHTERQIKKNFSFASKRKTIRETDEKDKFDASVRMCVCVVCVQRMWYNVRIMLFDSWVRQWFWQRQRRRNEEKFKLCIHKM